jgi:hypothetical protein
MLSVHIRFPKGNDELRFGAIGRKVPEKQA